MEPQHLDIYRTLPRDERDVFRLSFNSAVAGGEEEQQAVEQASRSVGQLRVLRAGGTAVVLKFNPYHDEQGRFASGDGGSGAGAGDLPEDVGGEAPVGREFLTYRLARAGSGVENTNVGNARALADHLVRISDIEAPSFVGGSGDTIGIWGVTLDAPPAAYVPVVGRRDVPHVGRRVQSAGEGEKAVSYSLPMDGAGYRARLLGQVPLSALTAALRAEGYRSPDDAGTNITTRLIRQLLRSPPRVRKDDDTRTLYVKRRLLNAGVVRAWAAQQGIRSALPAGDMHVTVAFSKTPVDWSRLEPDQDAIVVMDEVGKANPYHDELGRFASASGDVTAYHGTTKSAVASILKEGLVPGHGLSGFSLTGHSAQVFSADTYEMAMRWAKSKISSKSTDVPVVLKITIPAKEFKGTRPRIKDAKHGVLTFRRPIKPEWITVAKEGAAEKAEDGDFTFYAVLIVRDDGDAAVRDDDVEKTFDPDQPRDERGWWGESGGGGLEVFHGTLAANVQSILDKGIALGQRRNFEAHEYEGARGRSVYVSTDLGDLTVGFPPPDVEKRDVHQFPPRNTPNGALVLRFESPELAARWRYFRDAGASWDFPEYQPHVTITYSVPEADVESIEPYRGPLIFGPEEFAEVDEGWAGELVEEPLTKFNPNHDERGRFASGPGSPGWEAAPGDRAAWPEHIRALGLPPAWTDVQYNTDPAGDMLAVGVDAKGRSQRVYSERFAQSQAALKFARVQEMDRKFDSIEAQVHRDRASGDSAVREHADAAALILATGLRPGSDADTGAERRAYGATTLEARHVVSGEDGVRLRFVGKSGKDLDIPVEDARIAGMLVGRAEAARGGGGDVARLFPRTDAVSLRAYVRTLDGGGFKTKDIRTTIGTRAARAAMRKMPTPKTRVQYKRAVRTVAKIVSARLGNTPTVALQSYIDPHLFGEWRNAARA